MKKLSMNSIFSRESLPSMVLRSASLGKKDGNDCAMMTLPQGLQIVKILKSKRTQNSMICCVKIKSHSLGIDFDIEFDPKVESIDNISKKVHSVLKEREKSFKRRLSQTSATGKSQTNKLAKDECYVGYSQKLGYNIRSRLTPNRLAFYPSANPSNVLSSYSFPQNYSNYLYSETFVVLFGEDGICLMNWNFEQIFVYKKLAIDCCFVDELVMIFASKDGRILMYEIVEKRISQLFDLNSCEEEVRRKEIKSQKELKSEFSFKAEKIYNTKMELFYQKKLISPSSEEEYKIIAIANGKKLYILSFKHMKRNWTLIQKE